MAKGTSVSLHALGAILAFVLQVDIPGMDDGMLGWIVSQSANVATSATGTAIPASRASAIVVSGLTPPSRWS